MDPEELVIRLEDPDGARRRITVHGELDVESAPALRTAIEDVLVDGLLLVVDLGEVEFIDSSALRVIVHAANELSDRGGRLVVDGLSPAARRIFEVTGLLERLKGEGEAPGDA